MLHGMRRLESVLSAFGCVMALLMAIAGCAAPITAVTPTLTAAPAPTPVPVATATPRPTPDARQILAQLRRSASLQGVAEQCANAIGAPAGLARVRIEPPTGDGCVPCNKLPLGYLNRGVPVSEVAQPLADGAWIWLTVENLLCIYLHDAGEFKPSSVTQW